MKTFREISPGQLGDNPFRMIGQDWMLIAAKSNGKVNAMTASWGAVGVMWHKDVAFVVIRPQRYTKELVDAADTFSLTVFPEAYRKTLSYMGSASGRDEDKIAHSGLTVLEENGTPYFGEARLAVILKKLYVQPLEPGGFLDTAIIQSCYPQSDFHILYVGEIVKVLEQS